MKNDNHSMPTRTAIDYTSTPVEPRHSGVLAVYTDKTGNRYGVDLQRVSRAWADIVILHSHSAMTSRVGDRCRVQPKRISKVQPGDAFWWHWPNVSSYDYDRVDTMLAAATEAHK